MKAAYFVMPVRKKAPNFEAGYILTNVMLTQAIRECQKFQVSFVAGRRRLIKDAIVCTLVPLLLHQAYPSNSQL